MAKHMLWNAWVRVNAVDLSDHVNSVEVAMSKDDVQVTAMGQGGIDRVDGIRDDHFNVVFWNDFASASVDATLSPLFLTVGTQFLVEVAHNGTTISATNPKFSGSCVMLEYTPISGAVGDASQNSVTFAVKGTITRATA